MQHTSLASHHSGMIRNATLLDSHEISRLIAAAAPPRAESRTATLDLLSHGHLLVLELDRDLLGAAVHVDVTNNRATVNLLVVDPALRGRHIAERMSGVACALCEAYGYQMTDPVVAPRRVVR